MRILGYVLTLSLGVSVSYFVTDLFWQKKSSRVTDFLQRAKKAETAVSVNIPIYADLTKNISPDSLREHLVQDHLNIAKKLKLAPVTDSRQIDQKVKEGLLVSADPETEKAYYFYNVSKELRYLHPSALRGLDLITGRLQKNLHKYPDIPEGAVLKIAVSSALRPGNYQNDLRSRNSNATLISSHAFGVSFDIFYEDFYFSLPADESWSLMTALKSRTGYWLGDSLRRQFHAVLFETLYELQREGKIYVIWEKLQRCYHVTTLP